MTPRELEKYLRKALIRPVEPESPAGLFRHFIAMPVMDELEELPGTLASLRSALSSVEDAPGILLVVNHGPNAAPERKAHNLELLEQLRSGKYPGVYWVDAASPGKELTNGVGEARRIGILSIGVTLVCRLRKEFGGLIVILLDTRALVVTITQRVLRLRIT